MRRLLAKLEFKSGGYLSPTVAVCMGVNLAIFLLCFFTQTLETGGMPGTPAFGVMEWLAARQDVVLRGEVWRLLTAGFTHVDFLHLLFNLAMLGFFGHVVEQRLGTRGFTALVLLSVVLGNGLHVAFFPEGMVIGFSGAALATVVAFATIAPRARVVFFVFFMPAWLLATILVLIDVFGVLSPRGSGVAHLVHLIGAALGFAAIFWQYRYLTWWKRTKHRVQNQRSAQQQARTQREQDEIDRLLEKVSSEGLPSLTPQERRFLDDYSKRR